MVQLWSESLAIVTFFLKEEKINLKYFPDGVGDKHSKRLLIVIIKFIYINQNYFYTTLNLSQTFTVVSTEPSFTFTSETIYVVHTDSSINAGWEGTVILVYKEILEIMHIIMYWIMCVYTKVLEPQLDSPSC